MKNSFGSSFRCALRHGISLFVGFWRGGILYSVRDGVFRSLFQQPASCSSFRFSSLRAFKRHISSTTGLLSARRSIQALRHARLHTYANVIMDLSIRLSRPIRFFDTVASNIRCSKESFILYYPAINKVARQRPNFFRRAVLTVAASRNRAPSAALRGSSPHLSRGQATLVEQVYVVARGSKMLAADRFGLRFSLDDACKPARSWSHEAKTQAKTHAIRLHRFGSHERVNSSGISSRVETAIAQGSCTGVHTGISRAKYHYCSINPDGRTSENRGSICGNTVPWNCASFRIPMINKHLDLSQNGPPLANCVAPARVRMYWCPESS